MILDDIGACLKYGYFPKFCDFEVESNLIQYLWLLYRIFFGQIRQIEKTELKENSDDFWNMFCLG